MEMARRGAKVLMLCRDLDKAEATAKEIRFSSNIYDSIFGDYVRLVESAQKHPKLIAFLYFGNYSLNNSNYVRSFKIKLVFSMNCLDSSNKTFLSFFREETGATVVVETLDLASLASVRQCAQKLIDTEDKIDILINNAG